MNIIDMINKYIKIYNVERTGWKIRGVERPESVAEHIFSCILLSWALLPDKLEKNDEIDDYHSYDKNLILHLILIHDLGEIDIGDIVRGTKTLDDKQAEYKSIKNFLYAIKQTNSDSTLYDRLEELWIDMESGDPKNINAKIAKEIDYIQGAYQYFIYCISNEVKFDDASCTEWINEVSDNRIKTSLGKKIRKQLILSNSDFISHKELGKFFSKLQ